MSCVLCWVLASLFGLLGVAGLAEGTRRLSIHRSISGEDPTPIGRIDRPGVAGVEGRVRVADDTLAAPITGRESVLADWSVREFFGIRYESTPTVAEGIDSVPFVVDDGTGDVLVDAGTHRFVAVRPLGGWLHFAARPVNLVRRLRRMRSSTPGVDDVTTVFAAAPEEREVDAGGPLPDHLREFEREVGIPDRPGAVTRALAPLASYWGRYHGDRTYAERTLEPGDPVYVHGVVEPRDPDAPRPLSPDDAVLVPPRDEDMVISTRGHAALAAETDQSGRRWLYGGLIALVVAAGFVAAATL